MAFRTRRSSYQRITPKVENTETEKTTDNEKTQRILECPVCIELPKTPVYQCSNGHLVCNSCYSKISNCPICRVYLNQHKPLRNLTAEQFLDDLCNNNNKVEQKPKVRRSSLRIPCKNALNGCELHWNTNGEAIGHLKSCKYRLVFCPDLRCARKVPLACLFHHINDDHPADDFTKLQRSSVNFSLVIKAQHYRDETFWKPAIMHINHMRFFRECLRTDDGQWKFWVYMDGTMEEAADFVATVKLFNSKKAEVVVQHSCSVLSLDVSPKDVSSYTIMTVQDPVIQSIEYNGKLSFFVEISRK